MSAAFLAWASHWSPLAALLWTLVENTFLFGATLLIGHFLVRRFAPFPVGEAAPPLTTAEIIWAGLCVVLNTGVTYAGWFLWQAGWISIAAHETVWSVLRDVFVLILFMDVAMYFLHRTAHHPWIFSWLHKLHHVYDNPRPLTLFVLHPLEVLSFGGLWLLLLCVYSATFSGMAIYLTLNVAFGLIGHLNVEPFPASWANHPVLRYIGGSAFHARHHHDARVNFGFYTTLWDKIFNTLGSPSSPVLSAPPTAARSPQT